MSPSLAATTCSGSSCGFSQPIMQTQPAISGCQQQHQPVQRLSAQRRLHGASVGSNAEREAHGPGSALAVGGAIGFAVGHWRRRRVACYGRGSTLPRHGAKTDVAEVAVVVDKLPSVDVSLDVLQETDSKPQGNQNGRELGHEAQWEADKEAIANILTGNPLNVLLAFVPLGAASTHFGFGQVACFGLNSLAIIPLANILGAATEQLALQVGPALGGLLNATLGNAVEMIITVFALQDGLIEVVKGSLVGSILSNLLFVLGMSFFVGGISHKEQKFNATDASTQTSLLLISVMALMLPTIVAVLPGTSAVTASATSAAAAVASASGTQMAISRGCALILALLYGFYLYFQFASPTSISDDEEEPADLSAGASLAVLALTTVAIAICSEGLTNSVDGVTSQLGISQSFVGVMLLPIIGNAAEHFTAVTVAAKNKMDLSLSIALGSSTQIALFMVPFSVFVGWLIGAPMDLNFHVLPACVMLLTTLVVSSTIADGRSNWLEGAMLLASYILIGITFWFV